MPTAFGAAYQDAEKRFGGPLREVQTSATVGLAQSMVVAHDPERVSLTIVNWGAADIVIAIGASASLTNGIRVTAGGGFVTMSLVEDSTLVCQEYWGISGAAANTVYVLALRRETQRS